MRELYVEELDALLAYLGPDDEGPELAVAPAGEHDAFARAPAGLSDL